MEVSSEKIYKGYPFKMKTKIIDSELLALATKLEIRYLKPNGTQYVSNTATVTGGTTDTIECMIDAVDNDIEGVWKFWPYVENSLGEGMPGTPVSVTIYCEGE